MADNNANDEPLNNRHPLDDSVIVEQNNCQQDQQESPHTWWLNTRRRCHKHATIKRNHIRRRHY
ncbi:hypothetical protein [Thalassotalea crassostreae]|uniref:hypothetical protein n=1 Tax=Thalassotalea crassostreae TaxID=1763536 RepID=UPI0012FD64FE|nr:hypothetical protein [Thalassotalea crassostreae]